MNLVKLFRKFVKFVRGGAKPWQIALSFALGVALGMTPTFNATILLAVLAFVLLNLNLGLLLGGLAVGKALCLALAPVTFRIGFAIIHSLGLEGAFSSLTDAPVLAWMDLHNYCFVGGLPVTLGVGVIGGLLLGRSIGTIRKALAAGGENSEIVAKLTANGLVKLLLRVLFGKQKATLAEMLTAPAPVLRKGGLIACVVVAVLVVGFQMLFLNSIAASAVADGLGRAVGAEANVEAVELSLGSGALTIKGLQLTDPDKPTHNLVQIDTFAGDVSLADILRRRFVLDEVTIDVMQLDTLRAAAGEVFRKRERPVVEIGSTTVSTYFENGDQILDYADKIRDYLEQREASQRIARDRAADKTPSADDLRKLAVGKGYLRLSADAILARRPGVTIRRLVVDKIPAGDVGTLTAEALQLSSRPELHDQPMTIAMRSTEGFDATVTLDYTGSAGDCSIALVAPNIPIGDGRGVRPSVDPAVKVRSALIDVQANGPFSAETVDLAVVVDVHDLQADADGGAFGMDAATTERVLAAMNAMKVTMALEGPTAAPRVRIDREKTLASMGKGNLAGLLPKLGNGDGKIDKAEGAQLLGQAAKLLAEKKQADKDDKADAGEAKKPKPAELLRGLLRSKER